MALAFAENVLIMERGRIAWSGLASALEREPETIEKFLSLGTLKQD
jgi:branched-chain amino acid transport system ATP-binding protein